MRACHGSGSPRADGSSRCSSAAERCWLPWHPPRPGAPPSRRPPARRAARSTALPSRRAGARWRPASESLRRAWSPADRCRASRCASTRPAWRRSARGSCCGRCAATGRRVRVELGRVRTDLPRRRSAQLRGGLRCRPGQPPPRGRPRRGRRGPRGRGAHRGRRARHGPPGRRRGRVRRDALRRRPGLLLRPLRPGLHPRHRRPARGQPLCAVGTTGRSSAPHLHFELWPNGWRRGAEDSAPVDPLAQLTAWEG